MYNRHEYSRLYEKCKRCNIEKPLTDFCNRKGEVDGKHRYCKILSSTRILKNTTTPQVEKTQTTTKYTATKTKNILTNTVTPTTTPKKNYTGNGIEQNTTPI
jgi:hypothetical protein